jgi:hypothetical protein
LGARRAGRRGSQQRRLAIQFGFPPQFGLGKQSFFLETLDPFEARLGAVATFEQPVWQSAVHDSEYAAQPERFSVQTGRSGRYLH